MQIGGLNIRNKIMLDYSVKNLKLLTGTNHDKVFIIPSNWGPMFCASITPDKYPSCIPKAKWLVVGSERGRVGWISPEEFLAGQQLSMLDYMKDEDAFVHCLEHLSYAALIKFGGNAFHTSSVGSFSVAALLLPRFKGLFVRDTP